MRILFVVPYAPTRIRTRPYHFVRALAAAGHEITVATLWGNDAERAAVDALRDVDGVSTVVAEQHPVQRAAWNCLRALPGRDPLQAHYSWNPRLAQRLLTMVEDATFAAIHVEHLRGARYASLLMDALSRTGNPTPVVWDSVDCISDLFRQAARHAPARRVRLAASFELPRTERYEGSMVSRFDTVLVTARQDRDAFLALASAWQARTRASAHRPPHVEVVPNTVDVDYFCPAPQPRRPMTLAFTGKMSYHANVTALVGFVEQVMPRVWAVVPDARLWVVGKDPSPEVLRLGQLRPGGWPEEPAPATGEARVFITGTVDDIRPFLRGVTLAVAPIQYGVGIQNKVLEALACATPVVATPQAVAALDVQPGRDLLVASDPAEFSAAIVSLLQDPGRCADLGQAGRAYVERFHDPSQLAGRLEAVYHAARSRRAAHAAGPHA